MAATILLVDSHEDSRVIYATALRHHGHDVVVADATPEVASLAARERPALVIVELSVSGAPGWDLVARILSTPDPPPPPLLALSSTGLPEHRQRALALGCTGCLIKPVSPLELLAEVDRVMNPGRGGV